MPELDLFMKYLKEAPDDLPPDAGMGNSSSSGNDPPEISEPSPEPDISSEDPPEMNNDVGEVNMDGDEPPELGDDIGVDDGSFGNADDDNSSDEPSNSNVGLDEKVSAIMNMNLYQRYLTLLNNIASQLSMVKDNSDILHTVSPDSLDVIDSLKKLDENIRLYLKNTFINENYSKNLLFFNKCLNLLKLLNNTFNENIKRGISSMNI